MNGVDNMIYMDSVSANNGVDQLFVDFDVKTDPNIDQVLAQLRVDQAQSQLPAQVTTAGLTVQKALTSPLMLVAINSPGGTLSQDFLTNYAIINLQDQLARVKGVSRVQVFGGQYAMRVWVKPDKLAKLGVTAPEVISGHPDPEQREPGRTDRRRADPAGPAIHLHRAHAGPPGHG